MLLYAYINIVLAIFCLATLANVALGVCYLFRNTETPEEDCGLGLFTDLGLRLGPRTYASLPPQK